MDTLSVQKLYTNEMFTTEFLTKQNHYQYGDWLKQQDDVTRQLYFGVAGGLGLIENLMDKIEADPNHHEILIAKNCSGWLGTLHIAEVSSSQVEFGMIVHKDYRGMGIGNSMLEEAIIWARNRNYRELFMHCLGYNKPIKHLCQKNGLQYRNTLSDSEVLMPLTPPSWITIAAEVSIKQRNVYHTFLQKSQLLYQEMYG